MKQFPLEIHNNPLRTRADVERALLQMVEPVLPFFSEGATGLQLGFSGVHYGSNSARMEAYSRLLWGLSPYWVQRTEEHELFSLLRRGLLNGTNPQHPEYWGDPFDMDQKIVEMAALALFIYQHHQRLALSPEEELQLHHWLNSVNSLELPDNNWRFFRILVNAMFQCVGWAHNQPVMEQDMAFIERCYLSNGWYSDGETSQMDYYIPFAMHYYGLVYSVMMEQRDPERSARYRQRAAEFAPQFLYWFDDEGEAVAFGRSMTYRFAQCAFFSALAYANLDCIPWGVMKSRVLGNLRTWLSKPIFTPDGLLTIGYGYPNLIMSEHYNAPGSPYWSFKSFLVLALDENHPFWTAEEQIPQLEPTFQIPQARMLLARDNKQVQMFVAGQCCNRIGQNEQKYEKFVYSSAFGFSVSRGFTLEEGAFDSMLVVSEADEDYYHIQHGKFSYELKENGYFRHFSPLPGVTVEVELELDFPSHIRKYRVTTDRAIDVADGGFAISAEQDGILYDPSMVELTGERVRACFPWGESSIECRDYPCQPALIKVFPNTNLLYPLTRIPTIKLRLEAGTHCFTTRITGKV